MHKSIKAAIEKDRRLRPFDADPAAPPVDDPARSRGGVADSLAELERRYDGPIPAPLRAATLAGGAARLARRRARADLRVYRGLIGDTIACLRALRRSADHDRSEATARESSLLAQLRWYRDRRRETLRRLVGQSGAADPCGRGGSRGGDANDNMCYMQTREPRTEGQAEMSEFQSAGRAGNIGPGTMTAVALGERDVAVVNVGGDYFAFENKCTCITHFAGHVEDSSDGHRHVGDFGRLTDGALDGDRVTCPMHFTVFDVRNGRPLKGPGEIPVNTYEVRLDQGNLMVALMSDAERHFWDDPGNKERP